jgi:hypothetical protein
MPKKPGGTPAVLDLGANVRKKVSRAAIVTAIKPRDAGVLHAKDQSFGARVALFARGVADPGFKPPSELSFFPFTDKYHSDLYAAYDGLARGFIAEALKWQGRGVVISGNQGTAPELALVGAHLVTGNFHLGVNLFHQSLTLSGFRANGRLFTADVAATYCGQIWAFPIDGHYFHTSSMTEILDSVQRDYQLLSVAARVLDVLDTQCYVGQAMLDFLHERGSPIW